METFDGHNNAHVDGNAGNNNGKMNQIIMEITLENEVLSKTCDIEHFPLQRWVCVNISLTNNILDISFNGDLVKSCMLPGAPVINNSDLLVCPWRI